MINLSINNEVHRLCVLKTGRDPIIYKGCRPDHVLFGMYVNVMHKLVLAVVYLCTKVEDSQQSNFTHSKDTKEDPKFKNRGNLGWLWSRKIILILGVTITV